MSDPTPQLREARTGRFFLVAWIGLAVVTPDRRVRGGNRARSGGAQSD